VPGKTLTAFTVNYAPAASHAGIITPEPSSSTCFRAIKSENSATGPVKVYKAGEA
jgi:hypothetical protein